MKKVFLINLLLLVCSFSLNAINKTKDIIRSTSHQNVQSKTIELLQKNAEALIGRPYGSFKSLSEIAPEIDTKAKFYDLLSHQESKFDTRQLDCVTFIEVVLAKTLAELNPGQSESYFLRQLRFKNGLEKYFFKNHFHNIDWIKNNGKYLEQVSNQLGYKTLTLNTLIQRLQWAYKLPISQYFAKLKLAKHEPWDINLFDKCLKKHQVYLRDENSRLDYIPSPDLANDYVKFVQNCPHAAIVNIVRPNFNTEALVGTNLDISHTGLILKTNDKLYFYHASTTNKKVERIEFLDYLSFLSQQKYNSGINVLRIKNLQLKLAKPKQYR